MQFLTDTHPLPPQPGGSAPSALPAEGRTRLLRFDVGSGIAS